MEELECSHSTVTRLLDDLRDFFHAPDVKMLAPEELKQEYRQRLEQALSKNNKS